MKIQRNKKFKKRLDFYRNNFGFHPPYKLIVDGTFCHAALENKVNIKDQLMKLFEDKLRLFTTPCIVTELQRMGPVVFGALLVVKQFTHLKCQHTTAANCQPVSAANCLLSLLKSGNKEKFCVATQDGDLRRCLARQHCGAPVLYLHGAAPTLQRPSHLETDTAQRTIQSRTAGQTRKLDEMKTQILGPADQQTRQRRKQKRIKGPNPLSCKKRSRKTGAPVSQEATDDAVTKKRARKKRVRIAAHVREELARRRQTQCVTSEGT